MYPDITHHFTKEQYTVLRCDFHAYIFIDHTSRQKRVVIHPDQTSVPASDRTDFILKVLTLEYKLKPDCTTFFLYIPPSDFLPENFFHLLVSYENNFPSHHRLLPSSRQDLEYAIQEPFDLSTPLQKT